MSFDSNFHKVGIDAAQQQAFFGDTDRLQELKLDKDNPESLKKIAKEFEAIFIQMALKAMRAAQESFKSGVFNTNEIEQYQDMHDKQLALELANTGRLGLAQMIEEQMSPERNLRLKRDIDPSNLTMPIPIDIKPPTTRLPAAVKEDVKIATTAEDQHDLLATQANSIPAVTNFKAEDPIDFVEQLLPIIETAAEKLAVDPKVLIAQAALETGWGQKLGNNNLFNIKAHNWQGAQQEQRTTEFVNGQAVKVSAKFRSYQSVADSINDYVNFISGNQRYQAALQHNMEMELDNRSKQYIKGIHNAGYATDPRYSEKVLDVYERIKNFI